MLHLLPPGIELLNNTNFALATEGYVYMFEIGLREEEG